MISFDKIHQQLTELGWPPDVWVSIDDFQTIRCAPPFDNPIRPMTDVLGEYIWFMQTRIRPKTREIPTLTFNGEDDK